LDKKLEISIQDWAEISDSRLDEKSEILIRDWAETYAHDWTEILTAQLNAQFRVFGPQ